LATDNIEFGITVSDTPKLDVVVTVGLPKIELSLLVECNSNLIDVFFKPGSLKFAFGSLNSEMVVSGYYSQENVLEMYSSACCVTNVEPAKWPMINR